MPRYRSKAARARDAVELPEGWTPHDGYGLPLNDQDKPAVLFRSGLRMQPGKMTAAYWMSMAAGDCWTWRDDARAETDIIAWTMPE